MEETDKGQGSMEMVCLCVCVLIWEKIGSIRRR